MVFNQKIFTFLASSQYCPCFWDIVWSFWVEVNLCRFLIVCLCVLPCKIQLSRGESLDPINPFVRPMIYLNWDGNANHYTTDVVIVYL